MSLYSPLYSPVIYFYSLIQCTQCRQTKYLERNWLAVLPADFMTQQTHKLLIVEMQKYIQKAAGE